MVPINHSCNSGQDWFWWGFLLFFYADFSASCEVMVGFWCFCIPNCSKICLYLIFVFVCLFKCCCFFRSSQVAGLLSWHARVAILHFVQISVFGNFFLLQNEESQTAIRELLLHLLCDERLEVIMMMMMVMKMMMLSMLDCH